MADRKPRGKVDTATGEVEPTISEDALGGLPRSNYLAGDFVREIGAMTAHQQTVIMDKLPVTKRGQGS